MMHKTGERISKLRKERNMSQEDLASLLNVSRQTISKWESGETYPDVYNSVALAKLFHVSLDVLILGKPGKMTGPSYMGELKDNRHKTNLRAILVGSSGTTALVVSSILLETLNANPVQTGITLAIILPFLMFCWGFAIWGFIKVARINQEISYLEKVELMNLQSDLVKKNVDSSS
jgi:transcriptional regulator with XRE-family HTH domain